MKRKINFYAGPSMMPIEVFETIQEELLDYQDSGLSLMETSHRSEDFDEVHNAAISLIKEIMNIPDNYNVLFLGGGATMQFSMIPMNFLQKGKSCDFTLTGAWARKAYADAVKIGQVNVIYDGADTEYRSLPDAASLHVNPEASYLHITSNETIGGIQWKDWPTTSVPIVCDMSSDILSRPVPIEKFGLIYASAQKNLGPSGVTVVIIRDDMLEQCSNSLTAYMNYQTHAAKNSLYNTPPVFPIYAMKLVLERMKKLGGLPAITDLNQKKASLLYDVIENSDGYYRSPVSKFQIRHECGFQTLRQQF